MMKNKIIYPALAFVFAIGMSFATEKSTADTLNDWVDMGTHVQKIAEVDCGDGDDPCKGQINGNGPVYQVYDDQELNTLKRGSGDDDIVLIPVS